MSKEEDQKVADNYAEGKEQATRREWSAYGDIRADSFLAGASHIRSTVVAPLEAKLTATESLLADWDDDIGKLNDQLSEAQAKLNEEYRINGMGQERELKLITQLSEAQRVIKDFRGALNLEIEHSIPDKLNTLVRLGPPHCLKVELAQEILRNIEALIARHPAPSDEK